MIYKFNKHYTRDEARKLLPNVKVWLNRLVELREELRQTDEEMAKLMEERGDVGGPEVNSWLRKLAEFKHVVLEFQKRDIQIKDLERGLLDFPAIMAGREVFLCWERGEEDIDFWHDLDAGYAGREPL